MTRDPDRLYHLLPVVHRQRDSERGEPLRALLQVVTEQVDVLEDDLARQYADWFIETCDDWVVPYIGALIGYETPPQVVADSERTALLSSVITPRRAVANSIRDRRRKGTLPLLELIAKDTADWPARAVEFYRLLAWMQPVNHHRLTRGRTADLRDGLALTLLGGPFDSVARTIDVRRITSTRTQGTFNVPHVGAYVWRLKPYAVAHEPAYAREELGSGAYTFSVLGNDLPLFTLPVPEPGPDALAEPPNVPAPILRRVLAQNLATYYGPDKSFAIWAEDWPRRGEGGLVEAEKVIVADLSGWHYQPARNHIAVDPELGRIAFHKRQAPAGDVHVRYHYGFSDDTGGGAYPRALRQPGGAATYPVGEGAKYPSIGTALEAWRADDPDDAVIEIVDGGVYTEPLAIALREAQSLQLRARNGTRAVLRLLDYRASRGDAMAVQGATGSRFVIDGVVITGRSLQCRGPMAKLRISHATLVPGWSIGPDCSPSRPVEPSLELIDCTAVVTIERSILGSIQVSQDEVGADPALITITDSIVDATSETREAVGAPSWPLAHAVLRIHRSTVIGQVQTHAILLAEDSLFTGTVRVARRQIGCMRFCYVPAGSRTPHRYRCQPDLAVSEALEALPVAERGGPVVAPIHVGGDMGVIEESIPESANLRLHFDTSNPAPAIGETLTLTLAIDNLGPRTTAGIAITINPPRRPGDASQSPFEPDPDVTVSRGALVDDIDPPVWEIAQLPPAGRAVLTARLTVASLAEPPHIGAFISAYTFLDDGAAYRDRLREEARSAVHPLFVDRRYGRPGYCQLDLCTAPAIREGASDASEMGAFHDLYQPQRASALSARLAGHVPAGMSAGLLFAS
ncbi:hypothetical protein [Halomonas sp. BM-2019]|uniref:hypothetical protein n=1 Tax=Halomonas sp. BM-2019 TaxID=2811227 RepID=UPI001B3C2830|nr:MAG: DUF11 domain-containing protein [Halomonas sp. BM-2019]